MQHIVQGEYGFFVVVDTDLDISDYDLSLLVEKPDGTTVEWNAVLYGDTTDKMAYAIEDGDLDQSGVYVLHARAMADGKDRLGKAAAFQVDARYERTQ